MGNKGKKSKYKYDLVIHPEFTSVDLNNSFFPQEICCLIKSNLIEFRNGPDFFEIEFGWSFHVLPKRKLKGMYALEIPWKGNKDFFRLVYEILDDRHPKIIRLWSLSTHNEAYDAAERRHEDKRRRGSKKLPRKSSAERPPSRFD